MKKYLPKTVNNPQGFTLVELMVAIAIMAILSVIGLTVFTNSQVTARDAKRKADIDALAKAMEANYTPGTGYSATMQTSWFAGNVIPTATSGTAYTSSLATGGYTICAQLERSTGNSNSGTTFTKVTNGTHYCASNQQ